MEVNEPKVVYLKAGNDISGDVTSKRLELAFNYTKARIAESLILELFTTENYLVRRNGFENVHQGMHLELIGNNDPAPLNLRTAPDLFVIDPTTKKTNYIEVKFRFNKKFTPKSTDLEIIFPDCYYIFVTPDKFYTMRQDKLQEGELNLEDKSVPLDALTDQFNLRQSSIHKFEEMATYFFNQELMKGNSHYCNTI